MQLYSPNQIDSFLNGVDIKQNRMIAAILGEMGSDSVCYLSRLFDLVRECYRQIPTEDIRVQQIVAWGTRSLGTIVRSAGYTSGLHDEILQWSIDRSDDSNALVAKLAIWGLGDFGVPPDLIRVRLADLAAGSLRESEPNHATIRSVAFRMLARVSKADASLLRDSPACAEYLRSVDKWIRELNDLGREGNWAHSMHIAESEWLRTVQDPGQ